MNDRLYRLLEQDSKLSLLISTGEYVHSLAYKQYLSFILLASTIEVKYTSFTLYAKQKYKVLIFQSVIVTIYVNGFNVQKLGILPYSIFTCSV
jgi:hypothetical protein